MSVSEKNEGADLGSAPLFEEKSEKEAPSYTSGSSFHKQNYLELELECLDFMAKSSFPVEKIVADDSWQRLSIDGGKDDDEWYIAHAGISIRGNPWLMCTFGTFAGGFQQFGTFKSWETGNIFSSEERKEYELGFAEWEERNKERKAEQERGRIQKARDLWEKASEEPIDHVRHLVYLSQKQVARHGIRFSERTFNDGSKQNPDFKKYPTIVIPLRNLEGDLRAVQHIREDGMKRFDGPSGGSFHIMGSISPNSHILVAEGYATAASIYEAKGDPTVVAFDCGNLDPVIASLRKKHPENLITILGDDDVETRGNPGRTKAEAAAKKYGCLVAFPKFPEGVPLPNGKRPTDWNDLYVHFGGVEEVKKQFLKKNRLNPVDIADLLTRKLPPKKEILAPWLREKDLTMIYAPRGLGKTWFALNIGYAIASGGEFLKYKAQEPWRVLYVDGEMAAVLMQERITKIAQSSEKNPPDPSFFRLITHDLEKYPIRDLAGKLGQEDINAHIDSFDVLILDNLSCLVRSGDENEAGSWVIIQEWLLFLRKVGKTAIIIHHAGKGGQQRGTSKREDILDTVIALKKVKNSSPSDGVKFEVHYEKNRTFDGDAAKPFEASLVPGQKGASEWVFKDVEGRNREEALALLKEGMTVTDVAKEMEVHKSTVSRWKKNANL